MQADTLLPSPLVGEGREGHRREALVARRVRGRITNKRITAPCPVAAELAVRR